MKKVLFVILLFFSVNVNTQASIPPFSCCNNVEYLIPKSGTTKVSDLMFAGIVKTDCVRKRVYSQKKSTFKSFVLITFNWERGMGKIWNITDDDHVYKVVYTYDNGQTYTEEIEVLARTFSHMKPRGNPIKCIIQEIE